MPGIAPALPAYALNWGSAPPDAAGTWSVPRITPAAAGRASARASDVTMMARSARRCGRTFGVPSGRNGCPADGRPGFALVIGLHGLPLKGLAGAAENRRDAYRNLTSSPARAARR